MTLVGVMLWRADGARSVDDRPLVDRAVRGCPMGWTAGDGDALFRRPSDDPVDDHVPLVDGSQEAMRRLRFPFEPHAAGPLEQHDSVAVDEEEYRG